MYPRTVARLAAVQAVFCGLLTGPGRPLDEVLTWFSGLMPDQHYDLFGDDEPLKIHPGFFEEVVAGVYVHHLFLQDLLAAVLPKGWSLAQMEKSTQALFLCAFWELCYCTKTPRQVIFNEYVTVAHGFLLERGPAFVNALLEKAYPVLQHALQQRVQGETQGAVALMDDAEQKHTDALSAAEEGCIEAVGVLESCVVMTLADGPVHEAANEKDSAAAQESLLDSFAGVTRDKDGQGETQGAVALIDDAEQKHTDALSAVEGASGNQEVTVD